MSEYKKITINKNNYFYIFFDYQRSWNVTEGHHTISLLKFFRIKDNIKYENSMINIMNDHRKKHLFKIYHLVIEENNYIKSGDATDVKYLIIFNKDEIISLSRLIYKKNKGYINLVHTNKKYRQQGICKANIKKLISLVRNIKEYKLFVDIDNISAIKCYESCKFKIVKKIKKDKTYQMMFIK